MNLGIARFEGSNATEVLVVPQDEVAEEHHVVAAVHGRVGGVAVPKFPDGGGAVSDHITPTRIGVVAGDSEGQVASSELGEGAHQLLNADHASGDVPATFVFGLVDDIVKYLLLEVLRHHAEPQRQDVGGDGVVAVIAMRVVEVFLVEGDGGFGDLIMEIVDVIGEV